MAATRLLMRRLRELLRLKYEAGLSHRAIAQACAVGLGTVSAYLARATAAGVTWPRGDSPVTLTRHFPRWLRCRLFPETSGVRRLIVMVPRNWGYCSALFGTGLGRVPPILPRCRTRLSPSRGRGLLAPRLRPLAFLRSFAPRCVWPTIARGPKLHMSGGPRFSSGSTVPVTLAILAPLR